MRKLIMLLETLAIIGLLCLVVGMLVRQKKQSTPASAEISAADAEQGNKKIYMNDPWLGEMWLPALSDVPENSHSAENTVTRNGLHYYVEDGKITSALGVDVSSHQGSIDWETVKNAGMEFAILRCGYRTYGSGMLIEDECFRQNLRDAAEAGLDVGVYFYSQAINEAEAVEEAEFVLSLLDGAKLTYPVVFDWEVVTEDNARTDGLPVDMLTACTKAFCERIREAGYIPMVYQNKRTSLLKLDLSQVKDYDFWLAEYNDRPTFFYDFRIWQFCSDGKVPGIRGDCDINLCYTPYKD